MLYTEFKSYGVRTIDGWLHKKRKMEIGHNYNTSYLKGGSMKVFLGGTCNEST